MLCIWLNKFDILRIWQEIAFSEIGNKIASGMPLHCSPEFLKSL